MKKTLALAMTVALVGGLASFASAHGGWGGWGGGHMMQDRGYDGYGYGRHMYDRDYEDGGRGNGPGWCWGSDDANTRFGRVDKPEAAVEIVAGYIENTGNPNLKAGKVTEAGRDFEVEIVTKDGSLANKVLVEKATGRILPAYDN